MLCFTHSNHPARPWVWRVPGQNDSPGTRAPKRYVGISHDGIGIRGFILTPKFVVCGRFVAGLWTED